MKFRQYFVATPEEELNFTNAGDRLHFFQPPFSKQIYSDKDPLLCLKLA
jgi:hypothetical protein